MDPTQARMDVINWITGFVEKPNPLLNGWAPCPYARRARVDGRIRIEVGTTPTQDLTRIAQEDFSQLDVVVLIYDPEIYDVDKLRKEWQEIQHSILDSKGLFVLEDHPSEVEQVRGVCMNQGTWALLFVQQLSKLEDAAKQLAHKGFYHDWPEDYLSQLFEGRQDPRK
jgi:hypothetical protein